MSLPTLIRPTRPDHAQVRPLLDALDRYLASLYAPEHNHILDVQALLAPEVHFVAAWQGEHVVGCGALRRLPPAAETGGRPAAEIKRMFVQPDNRGQRLGEQLLQALETEALAQQLALAVLETGAEQAAAVRLYRRCGYVDRGPYAGYPDNGLSLFMARELVP